jgi:hypothetical protein
MTADRLEHLANMADEAARYFRRTNPAWARTMAAAATAARRAATHEREAEDRVRMQAQLVEIKKALR